MSEQAGDVVERIEKLTPKAGDVVALHLATDAGDDLAGLVAQLQVVADRTRATVLLLPAGVSLDHIDEREMLARGWLRVGPLAHTTAQLHPSDEPATYTSQPGGA